ncbi:MAG TPA: DinB family protein [Terriglobales bacterium]|nr:DinB family protein [Terriglobales bacterium]
MAANPISTDEKGVLRARLEENGEKWLACIRDVSEEQAQFSPGEGQWNILQVAEHVAVAERQMLAMWKKIMQPGTSPRAKDDAIVEMQSDRNKKNDAPERSVPTGRFHALRDAEAEFELNRQNSISALLTAEGLREKTVEHPLAGLVDGYQLFLVMAMHPLRHVYQVEEIKAAKGFPAAK